MSCKVLQLTKQLIVLLCVALVLACADEKPANKPHPVELSREDTGYFCGMIVADHSGPKSQIILRGKPEPLWFTTTRDGIAFQRLPEETRPIDAFYISAIDLGGWEHPERNPKNMIDANLAWFVIDSRKLGSMGAPETIPFFSQDAAHAFIKEFGGRVVKIEEIPDSYVLGSGGVPLL